MTAEAVGFPPNTPKSELTLSAVVKLGRGVTGSPTDIARHFWERVDSSGGLDACWPWTGGHFDTGYGCVWFEGRAQKAHRIAWSLTHGPIADGVNILHHCDNEPCCNPGPLHLFAGSKRDNTLDMLAKGRHGGTVKRKLTAGQVASIRERYAAGGATLKQLGAEHGVTWVAIWKVVKRQTWRHVA